MNFQLEIEDQYNLLKPQESGLPLQHFFDKYEKELINVYIVHASKIVLSTADISSLKGIVPLLDGNFGLVIFTGDSSMKGLCDEIGSEQIVYLPTFDEAMEAVFMHELERGFRNELDQ